MREDYDELKELCAGIDDFIQDLDRSMRKQFKRRTRQACNALKSLSVLSQRPYLGQSRRSKWKLRIRQAIIYLFGQDTLRCALEQMDKVWDALKRHGDVNLVLGVAGQFEEMYRQSVELFRRLEHLVRRHSHFPRSTTISHTTRQSTSSNTETIDRQAMGCHQSGFDGLPDRGAAQRGGEGSVTNLGYVRNYFGVSLKEDPTTTAEPSRASDGNEGTSQNDQVGGINGVSIEGEQHGDVGERIEDTESALIDDSDDEVPVPTTTTATTTMLDVDTAAVLTEPPTGGENLGANSSLINENGSDTTWGPYPGGDDVRSHTGGDETIPDPESSGCKHTDVSYHSWNWSMIIYASAGVRMKCRTCGEQKSQAEFSSLLEKSEEGGAKLNWDHISNIRWWPGGAWSWG